MTVPLTIRSGGVTDRGLRRETNEDALIVTDTMCAVADGMGGQQFDDLVGDRQTHPVLDAATTCAELARGVEQEFSVITGDQVGCGVQYPRAGLDVVGEVGGALPGVELLQNGRTPRGVGVAPGLDPVRPESDGVGDEGCVEGVRFRRGNHPDIERPASRSLDVQCDAERVVSFAPGRGADREVFSHNGFGRLLAR
mgnify:CR=1 FL=1